MRPHQLIDANDLEYRVLQVGTLPNSLSGPVRMSCEPSVPDTILKAHQ
jgi:hypothetical protein